MLWNNITKTRLFEMMLETFHNRQKGTSAIESQIGPQKATYCLSVLLYYLVLAESEKCSKQGLGLSWLVSKMTKVKCTNKYTDPTIRIEFCPLLGASGIWRGLTSTRDLLLSEL